ncbi:MAG: hypothetical protein K2M16_07275 [Muribaculaceae bacterium]|nr:hypothetical protein [Muribaculaceae bacterium]
MKSKILLYIAALFVAFVSGYESTYASKPIEKENSALLMKLDSIIANQEEIVKEKEIRISGLRQALAKAKDSRERLGLAKQLYDEYIVFDSDSALLYATEARKLTAKVMPDDYDEQTRWMLNEAFIYTVQGLYDTTMELLKGIDSSRLSDDMKSMLYGSLSYIYSMRSVYLLPNKEMSRKDLSIANQYRDSIQAMHLPESHGVLWVPIAAAIDRDGVDISELDVSELKKKVDQSGCASRDNAIDAYWLSRYYEALGDNDSMVRYKTKAAINDALIVNREIAAIQELATYLFGKGDLNRAYNYLIYTVEQANLYHNRYRMVNLSDVLPTVRDAYREELEKRDHRLSSYVLVLGILSIILIASIVFIVIEFRKLKKMRNLLKDANDELHESVKQRDKSICQRDEAIAGLERANTQLNEANKQKLSLLAYAFKLTTQYINALEGYRKKLLKKYKVKQIDDLGVLINDPELIKEQYQDFYESFDKTVLSIYPDFVEDYNKTVGEEARVSKEAIAKTRTLNTKLRIYALRRLGITKSAEIAEMLNVSIRTVYNNRTTES